MKGAQILFLMVGLFLVLHHLSFSAALTSPPLAGLPRTQDKSYSAEEIGRTSTDVFFKRILRPEPDYHQFSAMWALTQKATSGDGATRDVIVDVNDHKPAYGWEYTHLGNIQVKPGDRVKKGTVIGEIAFEGLPHVHLTKVFSEGEHWGSWRYLCMPNGHFTCLDEEPPLIGKPFYFFKNNSDETIAQSASKRIVLSGDVDIVVAMRDGGHFAHSKQNGFGDRLAVSRITYEIKPVGGGKKSIRSFESFDFRKLKIKQGFFDKTYGTALTRVVYKHWVLLQPDRPAGDKIFNFYVITNCEGTESPRELNVQDRDRCWRTAARDEEGQRLFPNGTYEIAVTAYDFAGNVATESMRVSVKNE